MTTAPAPTTAAPPSALLRRRIRVARGEEPGDLLLAGGRVVNVFTGRIDQANVVIADGWIAGVGPYEWQAHRRVDVAGQAVMPSLIDAHIHVESTMLVPGRLAEIIVPHGTGTIIADPHEIANVMGTRGVKLLIDLSRDVPLDIWYMAPSCVPAMDWEHSGAILDAPAIEALLTEDRVLGLAEMMNFPGVLAGDDGVLDKLAAAAARGVIVDGHAPGVTGRDIVAYAAAGIRSDHESTDADEALAKAALGMLVQVREGSMARNLETLLPLLVEDRLGEWCLCTDDIHPDELVADGHLDALLRRVVAAGVDPARAIRHATLVPARHYGLAGLGAVSPGWRADVLVTRDLQGFEPALVVKAGRVVAENGRTAYESVTKGIEAENSVHIAPLDESAFSLRLAGDRARVIGIVPDQIVTRSEVLEVDRVDGRFAFDPARDVALVASIERHRATGHVGLGLVCGFGFRRDGAIGSSVAHDSHNLIVAGTNRADMLAATRALADLGGGFVVVAGGEVKANLPLPVAGLLSAAEVSEVCAGLRSVREAAAALGSPLSCPFGALSFLALSVIPELRITDQGLFDVVAQCFTGVDPS